MLGKFRRRLGANALRGRIGRSKVGMLRFEGLEFAKEPIVFGVGHVRVVQHVVRVVRTMQYVGQMLRPLANVVFSAAQRPLPSS